MFNKTTLGGKLPDAIIELLNSNYETLFETTEELTTVQIIEKLINKALQKPSSNDADKETIRVQNLKMNEILETQNLLVSEANLLKLENETLQSRLLRNKEVFQKYVENTKINSFIPGWLESILTKNTQNKEIINFYNSFKNKELIKPIDSENKEMNVVNLLLNHYIVRMLKGKYQPQITTQNEILTAFKNQ